MAQVEQRRNQLAAAKKRQRNILILVIALIVVATLVFAFFLLKDKQKSTTSSSTSSVGKSALVNAPTPTPGDNLWTAGELNAESVKDVNTMQGFAIGAKGFGSYNEHVPTVEFYISYACPACLNLEAQLGDQILSLASSGKANLVIHPVDTHSIAWERVATLAMTIVAEKQPEKVLDMHKALNETAYKIMFKDQAAASQQGIGDPILDTGNGALEKIKEIAQKIGVKADVISAFGDPGKENGVEHKWANHWVEQAKTKNTSGSLGTPLLVKDGKVVDLSKFDGKKDLASYILGAK